MLNASLHRRAAACGAPSRPTWQLQPQQPCFVRRAVRPVRFKDDKSEDAQTTDTTSLAAKKAATKIAVFSSAAYVRKFMEQPLKEAGFEELEFLETTLDEHTAPLAKGAPVVCLFVNDDANAKAIAKLAESGVQMIAMRCAGFDRVDLGACEAHGIKVVRVPTYSPTSVAEHAVGLLFAVNRKLPQAYTRVQAGNYSLTPLVGSELRGKTVGVLGTGAIGTEAARMFKGLGMEVLAYDIHQNPAVEEMGIPYHDMDSILPRADVISLHVPLLPSTYHLINKERVSKMKKGCILLNVSRGGLVEDAALVSGLESRQIGGLGMDVYENEGQLFFTDWSDMPIEERMDKWDRCFKLLCSYPQVLITPHTAFLTHEALSNIASTTITNIEEFLQDKQQLTNQLKPKPQK